MHLLLAALVAAAPATKTWTVTGSDIAFTMSPSSLVAKRADKTLFDLTGEVKKTKDHAAGDDDQSTWSDEDWQILSVVGSLISYEDVSTGYEGGAHPYATDDYITFDAAKADGKASLYDWVNQADVLAALKADGVVQKHVTNAKAAADATTVATLFAALDGMDDCISFDDGSIQGAFVFHHTEGDKVALRVALPYTAEACRGTKTVLGLLVPVTPQLKGPLERASAQSEGFVMRDAKAVQAAKAHFSSKAKSRK